MKNNYHWLSPFLMGVLILGAIWFVQDPQNFHYPELPSQRIGGFLTAVIASYIMYFIFQATVLRFFLNRGKKFKAGLEYTIVLLFITLATASASLFATFVVNHDYFRWSELIKNCGFAVPLYFIYYLAVRNSRVTEDYNRQTLQLEKTRSNQLETELKYLRAQYHPHFLFNALNTVYFQIGDPNADAKNTVELLSELLRYQLYNMEQKVAVSEEINFIKSYIRFQQLRMTQRLTMTTHFDENLDKQKIYPLIYQPFLENAFKYVGGKYWIDLVITFLENRIIFCIENSLPEPMQQTEKVSSGIGIENVKRRLELLYPDRHQLNIKQNEKSFVVELIINLDSEGK